jgi:UDP-N-acetylglucosamine 2-epimerase (non-hydrolysing)
MIRVLFILGTRPEAIKLAPVILHQKSRSEHFHVRVCVTGQHRDLLDQVLGIFDISPDFDLDVMLPGQTLCQSSARILAGLEQVLSAATPDMIVVQGDTTTTMCGSLAGAYRRVPVAHVEAGLRTGDMTQPFPEEMNRILTSRLASLHFAPTQSSKDNLLREGCDPSSILLTGNSGVDAVLHIRDRLARGEVSGCEGLDIDASRKLILVTAHRRENFGAGFERICNAVAQIANRPEVQVIFPVHPNPHVRLCAHRLLGKHSNIRLLEPLGYVEFIDLMRRAYLILTDSGGIQEEAPPLGKPVLLLREKTERMEGVLAGTVKLVGTCEEKIVFAASELLKNSRAYRAMSVAHTPYGDGKASARMADGIWAYFERERCCRATTALHQMGRAVAAWAQRLAAAGAS